MFKRLGRATGRAVLIAAAAGVGGAAVAYAAIPDSNGVIHGCFRNGSGDVRVIDSGSLCKKNESVLNWPGRTPTLETKLVETDTSFGPGGGLQQGYAVCPDGYRLTGGGSSVSQGDATMIDNAPSAVDQRWDAIYYLNGPNTIIVRAICARIVP